MTKRYVVDRIEGDYAVLVPDEGKGSLSLPLSEFNLKVNMTVDLSFDGERVVRAEEVKGESEARLSENKSRLHALFAKNKK